jgi:hypothetical protein
MMTMRERGATNRRRATALGIGCSTYRRWAARGVPRRRRRRSPPCAGAAAKVRTLVRELRGLPGADSLARSVDGISRRQAAALKRDELAAMERERKASAARVEVIAPGVVRGFDAVHVVTTHGVRYLLASGDGCIPYRTSTAVVDHYDGRSVADALDRDFSQSGAPLVERADRASSHRTDVVAEVLRAHGVLLLHGPPHYPRYYGQLERQNREHRAWLSAHPTYAPDELEQDCVHMRLVLNGLWRRPTLNWRTADTAWGERVPLTVDRDELREIVTDGAHRRRRAGLDADFAWRLAIESALQQKGLLRIINPPQPKVLCES